MSEKNVELLRRIYAEGPLYPDPDQLEFWEPDGDYYPVEKFPESRPCHGVEEIARFAREFQQAWEHLDITIEAITPVGDDRVLVHTTLSAEGRGSGVRLEGQVYACFWLRNGRIVREEDHLTLSGALRALETERPIRSG
jgi:hypothetical protein